mmetsp:Transcript_10353/g.15513  ORF Transcript_10353/g.15513 Transcript_10353/m.15513 type:complete len:149 (+) Transcript_10353:25-471(+)
MSSKSIKNRCEITSALSTNLARYSYPSPTPSRNGGIFYCKKCKLPIIQPSCGLRCDVCKNYFLCIKCFAKKDEERHDIRHTFKPIEEKVNEAPAGPKHRGYDAREGEWNPRDEILLISGLKKYGTEDWDKISKNASTLISLSKFKECF